MSCHRRARRLAKKTVGLLRGVLADQLQLAQCRRDIALGHGGQARQEFGGAFEAQAIERYFQVFTGFAEAAAGVAIGFADHAQGQGRAALHQVGDIAQGAATAVDGFAHAVMAGLRDRQDHRVEALDPVLQGRGDCRWDVRFINHGRTRSSLTSNTPGAGQIGFSP